MTYRIESILQYIKIYVSILCAMNLLRDILPRLELYHMYVKLLRPNQRDIQQHKFQSSFQKVFLKLHSLSILTYVLSFHSPGEETLQGD